jgi:hypothetical protein
MNARARFLETLHFGSPVAGDVNTRKSGAVAEA